jgi:hypothetical protein
MPRLHFIVRFEAETQTSSSCTTKDTTVTGFPVALETDPMRTVKTYIVIENRPSLYEPDRTNLGSLRDAYYPLPLHHLNAQ